MRLPLTALLLLRSGLSGSSRSGLSGGHPVLDGEAARRHWQVNFPGAARVSSVFVSPEDPRTLYTAAGPCVYALNAQDGRQRWQFCDPGGVEFVAPPLLVPRRTQDSAASPRLLLTAARSLYVLDAAADVSAASRVLGALELAATAEPLIGALSVDGSDKWLAWSSGILYGLRSARPSPGKSADASCLDSSPNQNYESGKLSLCMWSVRMADHTATSNARIHGVSLGDMPLQPPPSPPSLSFSKDTQQLRRRQVAADLAAQQQTSVHTDLGSPRGSDTPFSHDGVLDGPTDVGDIGVDTSSKLVNVWLHGGSLLSLSLESGERVGNTWAPPKPSVDGDGSLPASGDWAAAPHAAGVDAAGEKYDDGSSASVLRSTLVLLGTAWDTQNRRQLWTKQVGGAHRHERSRHSQLQARQKPEAFRSLSPSSSHLARPSSLSGETIVLGAEPLTDFPRRQCAVGRQVALSVSADQTHSMLYAADISTAQSGYAYSRTTPRSGTPNLKQAQLYDFSDRVQPKIVALNSKTGDVAWRHDPATVFDGSRGQTARLLGMGATPLTAVRLRPAAHGKNTPTAAVAYYTAVFKSRAVDLAPAADETAVEVLVGLNASGGVAWHVRGRARRLAADGGMLMGTSGSGTVFTTKTGAVACFGSEAVWLVGGTQRPPKVWMISNLDAPITAAATGQSVTAPPAGAAAGRGSESEQHLYVGIGVACDSCGLFGQPTGAALLALSTVPLPPAPAPNPSIARKVLEVTGWMIAAGGLTVLLLMAMHRCFCKRNVAGFVSSGFHNRRSVDSMGRTRSMIEQKEQQGNNNSNDPAQHIGSSPLGATRPSSPDFQAVASPTTSTTLAATAPTPAVAAAAPIPARATATDGNRGDMSSRPASDAVQVAARSSLGLTRPSSPSGPGRPAAEELGTDVLARSRSMSQDGNRGDMSSRPASDAIQVAARSSLGLTRPSSPSGPNRPAAEELGTDVLARSRSMSQELRIAPGSE